MQLPGMPGATDPLDRSSSEVAERLQEELKEAVQAEIKDIGTLRKELQITVPAKVIADHLDQNYAELMQEAIVPGFRKGRAPRALVEKRFGSEVRESLTTTILAQSFYAAVEKNELDVLGDPLFRIEESGEVKLVDIDEALQDIKLPPEGDFTYACEVEIRPEFELPELKGIEIKAPEIEITDEMVDQELLRQRKIRGRFEPVAEGAAERDDMLVADVAVHAGDKLLKTEDNIQVGVRPSSVDGIQLEALDEALTGVKPGEQRTVECQFPDDYERADVRGQSGRIVFTVHELKRLAPLPLEEFLQRSGFDQEQEARDYFRMMMENERDQMVARAKQEQVNDYLLENTTLELPEKLSARQADRAIARRVIELRQRGVPESDISARIDELRTSAREQAVRDLKLSFILDKVAEQLDIHVTDEEVNTQIALMARRYNRRFDRVRDELQQQGLLSQLAEQIRQDKCVARILEDAKIEGAPAEEEKKD